MLTPEQAMHDSLDIMEKYIDADLSRGIFYVTLPFGRHVSMEVVAELIRRYRHVGWDVDHADRRQQVIDPHFALVFKSGPVPK